MGILDKLRAFFKIQSAAEKRLLAICRGDRDQMERMIAGELSRTPGLSREAIVRNVVDRYRGDQR